MERERREKQAATQEKVAPLSDKKLPDSQPQRSTEKAAELFNTNRTYVNQAVKMKEAAPEVFEKVKETRDAVAAENPAPRRPRGIATLAGMGMGGEGNSIRND